MAGNKSAIKKEISLPENVVNILETRLPATSNTSDFELLPSSFNQNFSFRPQNIYRYQLDSVSDEENDEINEFYEGDLGATPNTVSLFKDPEKTKRFS